MTVWGCVTVLVLGCVKVIVLGFTETVTPLSSVVSASELSSVEPLVTLAALDDEDSSVGLATTNSRLFALPGDGELKRSRAEVGD